MKIRPVGAELRHADGRTDMTKLIVAFRKILRTRLTRHEHPCPPLDVNPQSQISSGPRPTY